MSESIEFWTIDRSNPNHRIHKSFAHWKFDDPEIAAVLRSSRPSAYKEWEYWMHIHADKTDDAITAARQFIDQQFLTHVFSIDDHPSMIIPVGEEINEFHESDTGFYIRLTVVNNDEAKKFQPEQPAQSFKSLWEW